jgi:chitinase
MISAVLASLSPLVSSAAAAEQEASAHAKSGAERRLVAYLPEWKIYGDGYFPKNLITSNAAPKLTHVLYAFANVPAPGAANAGTCQLGDPWADYQMPVDAANSVDGVEDEADNTLHGNFNQLLKLKKLYPNLKVMISVGGWSWSSGFSAAASTESSRKTLVSSCIKTFIEGHFSDPNAYSVVQPGLFDGIDIDWEYPGACGASCAYSPDDKQNFTLLLGEFRKQLDALTTRTHRKYQLSIAAPAGADKSSQIQLAQITPFLNFINLMTYDFNGSWNLVADHAAPLFAAPDDPLPADKDNSVESAVAAYLDAGVPPRKLNLGVPFYGHGWTGVSAANNGLYQTAFAVAPGDLQDYKALQGLSGFTHHYDPASGFSHWIYNASSKTFYSYDDAFSISLKAAYVTLRVPGGLGGVMVWDVTGDDANGTLIKAIDSRLH